jgi:Uma2 family endonuclease
MMNVAEHPSFSIETLEQRACQRGAVETAPMDRAAFLALPETNLPLEYIDGAIAVSPSPVDSHQEMILSAAAYLKMLIPPAAGTLRIAPLDVHVDGQNTVLPDIFWVSADNPRCKLSRDGYWYGAPDLVIEVLSSATARRDRGVKFQPYEVSIPRRGSAAAQPHAYNP